MSEIEPCDLSFDAIREYAQRVGEYHNVWDERGRADIPSLVAKLGGTITKWGYGQVIKIAQPGSFVIHLTVPASESRRRFGTAHALGWYFLHYLYPELQGERGIDCWGDGAAEVQANVFAATLLMPTQQFTAAFAEHDGDTWDLADQFGVSPKAVEVRAQVLGLAAAADSQPEGRMSAQTPLHPDALRAAERCAEHIDGTFGMHPKNSKPIIEAHLKALPGLPDTRVTGQESKLENAEAKIAAGLALADTWERGALRWADPLAVPGEVALIREALGGIQHGPDTAGGKCLCGHAGSPKECWTERQGITL